MLSDGNEGSGFCGAYGVDDNEGAVTQQMTPVRQTVAEVVADLRAVTPSADRPVWCVGWPARAGGSKLRLDWWLAIVRNMNVAERLKTASDTVRI